MEAHESGTSTTRRLVLVVCLAALLSMASASSAAAYEFVTTFGQGELDNANDIAIDAAGNVHVADASRGMRTFTTSGALVSRWGYDGAGHGVFSSNVGVDARTGDIYVEDYQGRVQDRGRIEKYNSSRAFVTAWGSQGLGDGQFGSIPSAVATDARTGDVYVVDDVNSRIQKFTSSGRFITKWGTSGKGNGQFSHPSGIATDPRNGAVYVADTYNGRIQKFTSSGAFLTKWRNPGPLDVATDAAGGVFVAELDSGANRVVKYSSTGAFVTAFGSAGEGKGQFRGLVAVATDSTGNVYAMDPGQIHKFARGRVPRCQGRKATIYGTSASEVLKGTRKRDVIAALGGHDLVKAGGGKDLVCGGKGNDLLLGQGGADRLFGQGGKDSLIGGAGRDKLSGGSGKDKTKQ